MKFLSFITLSLLLSTGCGMGGYDGTTGGADHFSGASPDRRDGQWCIGFNPSPIRIMPHDEVTSRGETAPTSNAVNESMAMTSASTFFTGSENESITDWGDNKEVDTKCFTAKSQIDEMSVAMSIYISKKDLANQLYASCYVTADSLEVLRDKLVGAEASGTEIPGELAFECVTDSRLPEYAMENESNRYDETVRFVVDKPLMTYKVSYLSK